MRKKDFEKPKKVVFEKLTVKEREKIKGGTDGPIGKPDRDCAK